jgi:hypothetical protein
VGVDVSLFRSQSRPFTAELKIVLHVMTVISPVPYSIIRLINCFEMDLEEVPAVLLLKTERSMWY